MNRPRQTQDGLPYRLYERHGKRIYSIGHKQADNTWSFRLQCAATDKVAIAKLRRQAIEQWSLLQHGVEPTGGTQQLIEAWLAHQDALPLASTAKRADSTIRENRREAANLVKAFGHLDPASITKTDGYAYLDACAAHGRPAKGNKEVSLLQIILEYGIRIGRINVNPLDGIRKNKIVSIKRYVSDVEIDLAVEVGRAAGGTRLVVSMALKTAWLCVRRSVEVRALTRESLTPAGIVWADGKSKTKAPVLIEWTPELRATIEEALQARRNRSLRSFYVFGNMQGQKYTKGGWKAVLDSLMTDCETAAKERGIDFERFSLQDCRPKGVSDKLAAGHTDTQDATGHTSGKMIGQVYDRRNLKKATAVK
jgi:integrase